jgi:hypothetical protein
MGLFLSVADFPRYGEFNIVYPNACQFQRGYLSDWRDRQC